MGGRGTMKLRATTLGQAGGVTIPLTRLTTKEADVKEAPEGYPEAMTWARCGGNCQWVMGWVDLRLRNESIG